MGCDNGYHISFCECSPQAPIYKPFNSLSCCFPHRRSLALMPNAPPPTLSPAIK